MSFRIVPGVRIEIGIDTNAGCCEGPTLMPGDFIKAAPQSIKGRITDREWSTAMRRLQEIFDQETPSGCASCYYICFEGVRGSMWLDHRRDKLNFRLQSTIKHFNECLFEPKGMCIAIINDGSTLAIALNPEECQVLKILS